EDNNADTDIYAIDTIEFYPDVFENQVLDTIKFDITAALQAWANGEVNGEENQGLYITTGQGWRNDEYLTLSGITAEDKNKRPYIEIIYSENDSSDLTPPEPVSDINIESAENSIILNWTNPDISAPVNADLVGIKIMRREGIIPFDEQDGELVAIIDNPTGDQGEYTDTGLITGKTYYYAVYTYDQEHNYSDKVWEKGTPGSPENTPTNFTASTGQGTVTLSWDEVTGANIYRLYREDSSGNVKVVEITVEEGDNPSYTYTDYLLVGDYTYRVTAINEIGEGPLSNYIEISITEVNMAAGVPEIPTGLQVNSISGMKIGLNWIDNSNNESGFVIERKNETVDGFWNRIAEPEFNKTSYIDIDILPDTEYSYRIKAVNSAGSSDWSEIKNIIHNESEPVPVKKISWEVISASQIKVEWEDTPNEDGYKVELFEITDNDKLIDTQNLSMDNTYCYFLHLKPDIEYQVRVTSIKGEDEVSIESDIIRTSADHKGGLFY
ncbi:MAG: fibronectin type III domain-containing protein, partial [Halanaerobiales bacterium]